MELPNCDVCGLSQTELGALAFSAPIKIDGMDGLWCRKTHICTACTNAAVSDKTKRDHDNDLTPKELKIPDSVEAVTGSAYKRKLAEPEKGK